MRKFNTGFTLIEIIVSFAAIIVLAVAATNFLFSTLTQRDQALAESMLSEQAETAFSIIGNAVRSAQQINIIDEGQGLQITGLEECWLFKWDNSSQQLKFNQITGETCSPPSESSQLLTSQLVKVTQVDFDLLAIDDSSRTVFMTLDLQAYRPLWNTTQQFSQVFVNLIDMPGDDDD